MVVRRNDARRRRLVVDPAVQLGDADGDAGVAPPSSPRRKKSPKKEDARAYSYGADRRNQLKTTDLIPKRMVSFLTVVMVLLAALWLLNYCAQNAVHWVDQIGATGLETMAIRGQGSLAGWFSSFLLIMTGLASLQIFALRQHRCDDYRGTYRLWLWLSALFVVASINCVANLGELTAHFFNSMTNGQFVQRAWVPLVFKLTALALLVARGAYEVRESRGSLAWVLLVWIAYSVAAVLQLPGANQTIMGVSTEAVVGNCFLFGTVGLLLAHLTYARFVFLRAHGLIAMRVKKEKVAKPKKKSKPVAKGKKAVAPNTTAEPSTRKTKTKPATKQKSKPAAKKTSQAATAKPTRSKPEKISKSSAPAKTTEREKSPSEVLREMAAASRAKSQSQNQSAADGGEQVLKLSKAQRRKQRKIEKQQRRAA